MASRRRTLLWLCVASVLAWNFFLIMRMSFSSSSVESPPVVQSRGEEDLAALRLRVSQLQHSLSEQSRLHLELLSELRREGQRLGSDILADSKRIGGPVQLVRRPPPPAEVLKELGSVQLPVLVMACNRPTVRRSLDSLLRSRGSWRAQHPVLVSQDCGHEPTATAIRAFGGRVTHMRQPDLSSFQLPPNQKRFEGYYKISRHYKWALDEVFLRRNFSAVIIVEDDLEVSPDFFSYFRATYPVLSSDPTLMCVSAWNDNGKADLIADDPYLLHRTDFFPGLGWMLRRSLWLQMRDGWPAAFWDEYLRKPVVRRERACIRPEISRSSTFGRIGVSNGQYFDKHLKFIRLNKRAADFANRDMAYLVGARYDPNFDVEVYTKPEVTVDQVLANTAGPSGPVRVTYQAKEQFRAIARRLGIMDDFKAGVPRTAYRGVVSIVYRGRRVYVAPRRPWKGYDLSWN